MPESAYFAMVADRDGRWMGACMSAVPDAVMIDWVSQMMESGAIVKPVRDRAEYDAWNGSVT